MNKLAGVLLQSRTQTHVAHLQVKSYAAHMALNSYYTAIGDLLDGLIEAYQGKNGIVKDYKFPSVKGNMDTPESCISYLKNVLKYVESVRKDVSKDTNIQNTIDEIVDLLQTTIYKLTYLK